MGNKIYKITCTANEMFYIGRTNRSLYDRLKEHLARLESNKHNKKFQNCYNKHGPESFIIELLESTSTGGYTTAGYSCKNKDI